ncbi:DUF4344 domain-containing metallopeptidase [Maliponia aquimaris]|uniref:Metallopeptidase n=1 Tax=Maliponia aquimaris TaxID=1673631 RepID=A0A238KXB8_9RHOB|nr:DUF4344 domain-containing metallopeptidase [Maliponia aquimaris]SMX47280.1 hypothetical protein MAA8898_03618 [Maliponia aquimaris]
MTFPPAPPAPPAFLKRSAPRALLAGALALASLTAPARADEAEEAFVEANILAIFYHELGHAMIDLLQLPVYGQEEDAADVASILLIDWMFEPASALDLAYDASFGFAAEAMMRDHEDYEIAWWDSHGPDEQRFYNTVCLFYGANTEDRDDFAADMGLPQERAEVCEEEFNLAWSSWRPVLEDLSDAGGHPLAFVSEDDSPLARLMADEIAELNTIFRWPEPLTVVVEDCGEPNAFYVADGPEIVMCTEFPPYLRDLYRLSE